MFRLSPDFYFTAGYILKGRAIMKKNDQKEEYISDYSTVTMIKPELKKIVAKNLQNFLKKNNITQKGLADTLGMATASINDYLNLSKPSIPPAEFFVAMKNLYGINIDDFMTKIVNSEEYDQERLLSSADRELIESYRKFEGIYSVYYLDNSSYKSRDERTPEESLKLGVLYIFESKSTVSTSTYKCIMILDIGTKEDMSVIRNIIEEHQDEPHLIAKYIAADCPDFRIETLSNGDFEIIGKYAYISLEHPRAGKSLAIFYNPDSNKPKFVGGLGTINSVSKGRDKMPTLQFIAISRKPIERSVEEIHRNLLLSFPIIKADKYAPEMIRIMKKLYIDTESESMNISELQKTITIRANMEMYIRDSVEHNLFRYAKVSSVDDDGFYHWITAKPEDIDDDNLL